MVKPYYEESGYQIFLGDCAEIAPALGMTFDLLATDPPYGLGEARGKNRGRRNRAAPRDYGSATWDDAPASADLIASVRAIARWQCIFGGNYFTLPPSPCWLVWDKTGGGTSTDFADAELAWTNYTSAVRIKRHLWSGYWQHDMLHKEERHHPTQKPLAVMTWAISLCPEVPTSVFDPFMGSGTTLRACKDLGIARAVGIDAEERWCEIAANRLRQGVLF